MYILLILVELFNFKRITLKYYIVNTVLYKETL